ncbi:type IV pili methyl-accepting chemotaxis transducer N-terminal domain-containing protein [Pelagibaculum spongiae]|uniref:Chemotaxis protein CheA n=1 Tax=Pelagibaculum spongiae TaxID=2080658 RepID=A0A2V1H3D8_9GAMM|nr:type IV pili methyl-accepting chemotaxis transducer N-terminal domain-containing protein [Pelagibaculum spongiae]PVZ72490.1 hypothetical protein DC094_05675 [Pelagibaculum spongiae]
MRISDYGKYKGIIVSVALFLLLDASVLLLNFYISFEIADDAVGVNVAGRQRMLSQRMMKSLLDIKVSQDADESVVEAINELRNTTVLFDTTLEAFRTGGNTLGTAGSQVEINRVDSEEGRLAVIDAGQIWQPYLEKVDDLLSVNPIENLGFFSERLEEAIEYGSQKNLVLLKLMNTLTTDLEQVASSKATRLRIIQTIGISLAIINFFIIMFHFVRQLRESDERVDAARGETQEILDTVNEGLFLLDNDLIIGEQHSRELKTIFGRDDFPGQSFDSLLKNVVSEKDLSTAHSFIKLLFRPNVKASLIGDLNPLNEVEIHISNDEGVYESKFIKFSFSRVHSEDSSLNILVTVSDITRQVQLAKELESAKQQGEQQMEMLTSIIHADFDMLLMFIDNSYKTFEQINEVLRESSKSRSQLQDKANAIGALVHGFKGESSALSLDQFVSLAHDFEDQIAALKGKADLTGNDFLKLTVMLDRMMDQTEATEKLVDKLRLVADKSTEDCNQKVAMSDRHNWDHLHELTASVAARQGKQVELIHAGLNDHVLEQDLLQKLNSITIQFIRNAISHGIELPDQRIQASKKPVGKILVRFAKRNDGSYEYVFQDDGAGFNLEAIRARAIEAGIADEAQAARMDHKQLISMIFEPDLSTQGQVDSDSGRGVGMVAVKDMVNELAGKMTVGFRKGVGSTFSISIPPQLAGIEIVDEIEMTGNIGEIAVNA